MKCDCCGRDVVATMEFDSRLESEGLRVCLDCWASEGDVDALVSPCGVDEAAEASAWDSLEPIACVVQDDEADAFAGL